MCVGVLPEKLFLRSCQNLSKGGGEDGDGDEIAVKKGKV